LRAGSIPKGTAVLTKGMALTCGVEGLPNYHNEFDAHIDIVAVLS
jgi:hypothetical protein